MSYYFANGNEVISLIKNHKDFRGGDLFYNQIIEEEEPWSATRDREGLIMIMVSKKMRDAGKITYSIHETYNGITKTRLIDSKELFNTIK